VLEVLRTILVGSPQDDNFGADTSLGREVYVFPDKRKGIVALNRQSPPFAYYAKDGAPQVRL